MAPSVRSSHVGEPRFLTRFTLATFRTLVSCKVSLGKESVFRDRVGEVSHTLLQCCYDTIQNGHWVSK